MQIRTYGLGLDYMGFDCSKLKLMIGVEYVDIRKNLNPIQYKQDVSVISLLLNEGREIEEIKETPTEEGYRRWIRYYDRDKALDDFKWASNYWLNKRDAIPTKKQRKCEVCVYRERCSKSNI